MGKILDLSASYFEQKLRIRQHDNSVKEGKLIEVFRGTKELDYYLHHPGYITVHTIGEEARQQTRSLQDRIFYVWQGAITLQAKNNEQTIPQGHKFNVLQQHFPAFNLINILGEPAIVVEFSNGIDSGMERWNSVVVTRTSHDYEEIGKVKQVTLHTLDPGDYGGCHYHTDGKKELFRVVEGEIEVYRRNLIQNTKPVQERFPKGWWFTFPDYYEDSWKLDNPQHESHAIKNRGNGLARLVELSNLAFDPESTMEHIELDIPLRRHVEDN